MTTPSEGATMNQSEQLAVGVVDIISNFVRRERTRWCRLLGIGSHQWEGWWKGELAMAIEDWAWGRRARGALAVDAEVKPRDFGLCKSRDSVDLVVGPRGENGLDLKKAGPRVWLELKDRATWWTSPAKGLGVANSGLAWDLEKWKGTRWKARDVVLACHLLAHNGTATERLPASWSAALQQVGRSAVRFRGRAPVVVGYPLTPGKPAKGVRWLRLDVFQLYPR